MRTEFVYTIHNEMVDDFKIVVVIEDDKVIEVKLLEED